MLEAVGTGRRENEAGAPRGSEKQTARSRAGSHTSRTKKALSGADTLQPIAVEAEVQR
jgi:hypothetical protein